MDHVMVLFVRHFIALKVSVQITAIVVVKAIVSLMCLYH